MNFSIDLNCKKLEDLIMTTRNELLDSINSLAGAVTDETVKIDNALASMTEVVAGLTAKVSRLELAAGDAADFSAESAKIEAIRASITAIIAPPVVPPVVVTPSVTPEVSPVVAPVVSPEVVASVAVPSAVEPAAPVVS